MKNDKKHTSEILRDLKIRDGEIKTTEIPISDDWEYGAPETPRHHTVCIEKFGNSPSQGKKAGINVKIITIDNDGTVDIWNYGFESKPNGIIYELVDYEAFTLRGQDHGNATKHTLRIRKGGERHHKHDEVAEISSDEQILSEVTSFLSQVNLLQQRFR